MRFLTVKIVNSYFIRWLCFNQVTTLSSSSQTYPNIHPSFIHPIIHKYFIQPFASP